MGGNSGEVVGGAETGGHGGRGRDRGTVEVVGVAGTGGSGGLGGAMEMVGVARTGTVKRPMYTGQDGPHLTLTDPKLAPFAHCFSLSWDHFYTGSKFQDRVFALLPLITNSLNYIVLYLRCLLTCQVVPRRIKTVHKRTETVLQW